MSKSKIRSHKMQSHTEENYLKIIYLLSTEGVSVQTNAIAERIHTKAASVTDMIRKLAEKGFVNYVKYQGVTLTAKGNAAALNIVRKHRLWEVFLVDKLNFKWDEVHEVAEELEHIKSALLIERLDAFLEYPKSDPHGDPIPDKNGQFSAQSLIKLNKLSIGQLGTISGVSEHSTPFLRLLEKLGLTLGKKIEIVDHIDFDGSMQLTVDSENINISREVAQHILITQN